ncbi:hypothetical protein N7462_011503 [Penicillium macrosclerotiorum]|uniref:uncharacterized protein n=1 Tax=Penicillium macrosclerotiorum TaxID=303699 RepID=UPI002547F890|nr:uncharacterized protein N7462_011503 [Penicillium macrosclerotiorum]KAJ5664690.1 hypothetical protein N7462_011503 [Penicillium macrosclerotiorum]
MEPATEEAGSAPRPRPPLSSPPPDLQFSPAVPHPTQPEPNITNHDHDNSSGNATPSAPFPDSSTTSTPKSRPASGVVPPWWQRHERNASRVSQTSLAHSTKITLEDHTVDPDSETTRGLWARSVSIDDYVVVQGKTGVGSYVVWNCTIQTLDGGPIVVRMRYSEFDDLRQRLEFSFPHAKSALPALPPKSVLFKFRPKFLESRRIGLEYFLNCVLLNPEFSSSPVVKDFLFGRIS